MNFKQWLEVAVLNRSGVIPPPPTDEEDDGDENFWEDEYHSQIRKWVASNSPCVKNSLSALADHLLNNNEPDRMDLYTNLISYNGGFGQVRSEWVMQVDGERFVAFENDLKRVLINCDIWKYLPKIGYQKARKAVEDYTLLSHIEYHLCSSGVAHQYLEPHIKFAVYETAKNNKDELIQAFIDKYNNQFRQNINTDKFKCAETFVEGNYMIQGKQPTWDTRNLYAWGAQKYAFGLNE